MSRPVAGIGAAAAAAAAAAVLTDDSVGVDLLRRHPPDPTQAHHKRAVDDPVRAAPSCHLSSSSSSPWLPLAAEVSTGRSVRAISMDE